MGNKTTMLGLKQKTVKLFPYNPEWAKIFKEEKMVLRSVLGRDAIDIQHFGSTAIPGLPAKPIIDILIAVPNLKVAGKFKRILKKLGYEYKGDAGVSGRLFFAKGSKTKTTHHLHFVRINSPSWKDNLLFRNYLQKHKKVARKYADLKRELAKKFPTDRGSYSSGKEKFIESVIKNIKHKL
ncbi:MAG: GrpB family protein [bacterium]|nr:GrpB family protein [bacterium]